MKKKKAKSSINLEKLAGGAFTEKLNEALAQVDENIQNPNTDASTKRGITVNIKFQPSKNREMVSTTIQVTTKLAATEAIETQMVMGTTRAGEIQIAEYGQMTMDELEEETPAEVQAPEAGQIAMVPSDEELEGDELLPEAVDVFLETGQASVAMLQRRLKLGYARAARLVDEMEAKGIVGPFHGGAPRNILITKEQWAAMKSGQQQPTQAPTDGKPLDLRNRGKKPEAEAPVLVAGRDYDAETGEVYETTAQTTGQVVPFINKAAQA